MFICTYCNTVYKIRRRFISRGVYIGTIHGSFDPMYSRVGRLNRSILVVLRVYEASNLKNEKQERVECSCERDSEE